MADSVLFIGWSQPSRGRENGAVEVFGEAVAYYTGLQGQGEIESFEVVFLEPHGGDLGGFFLLRGDAGKLAAVRTSDAFNRLNTRAALVVDGFGVVGGFVGDAIGAQMATYQEAVGELV
jgi:hypothetical protein